MHQNSELLCRDNRCLSAKAQRSNYNLNKKGGLLKWLLPEYFSVTLLIQRP